VDVSQRRLEPEQGTLEQDCCRRDILEKDNRETAGGEGGWSAEISVVGVVDGGCCGTLLGSGWDLNNKPEGPRSRILLAARLLPHENQRHLWTKISRQKGQNEHLPGWI